MGKEYVITDGNGYIRQNISGHYELTSNITLAETFKRYNLAKSVWQYAARCGSLHRMVQAASTLPMQSL